MGPYLLGASTDPTLRLLCVLPLIPRRGLYQVAHAGSPPPRKEGFRDFYHNWTNSILQQLSVKIGVAPLVVVGRSILERTAMS
jgi:hypothetical protein